jgi:hypothetical protein
VNTKLLGISILLMFCCNSAISAEANTGQQPQVQAEEPEVEQTVDFEESDPVEIGDAEVEDDPDASPTRVIPTEQISQDLGVSFPVDI